jgi:xanthine/uracil permease
MSEKASLAGKRVGFIAAGGFIAYAGFLALLAALILGLAEFMAGWLAALIVGLIVAAVGYFLLQKGLNDLKNLNPAPEKTIKSVKEDGQWLKQQLS